MREYAGACHCGAIELRYRTAMAPSTWSVRACQCSFCRAHAAITTSDPAGELQLSVTENSLLSRYRFGTGTTQFWVCRRCGVYVAATYEEVGVINVRALRAPPEDLPTPQLMAYGEESVDSKRHRRAMQWTPVVMPGR